MQGVRPIHRAVVHLVWSVIREHRGRACSAEGFCLSKRGHHEKDAAVARTAPNDSDGHGL